MEIAAIIHFKTDRACTLNLARLIVTKTDNSTFFQFQGFKVLLSWTNVIRASGIHEPALLRFPTGNCQCTCTLITFLFTNSNLSRRTITAPSLRTVLLKVTRFMKVITFELSTTITLCPRLRHVLLPFPFTSVLTSAP